MGWFESFILNEAPAAPIQPPEDPPILSNGPSKKNNKNNIQPPVAAVPPNADPNTGGEDMSPDAGAQDPNDVPPNGDPNASGDVPPDAGGQDPNTVPPNGGMPSPPQDMINNISKTPDTQDNQNIEQDIFSSLTPQQRIIQTRELKDQFKTIHNIILKSLDKINKISSTTFDAALLDFVVRKLVLLKSIVRDYMDLTFDTETYVKNKVQLELFKAIFNNLEKMINNIYISRDKRAKFINLRNEKEMKKFNKIDVGTSNNTNYFDIQ